MFPIVALTGATGTGKTDIAISVARETHAIVFPLDQLQRYKYLKEGVGLDLSLLKQIDHYGYQILSPWEVSGPEKYTAWLKEAVIKYAQNRPILIEGGCTSYLHKMLALQESDPLFAHIQIYALDIMPDEPPFTSQYSNISFIERIHRIIEETKELERHGFISESGLSLLLECEKLFKHPEHYDKTLAWAIRISAKIYCPAYLALKGRITVDAAMERIAMNILQIRQYQSGRIHEFLPSKSIYQLDKKNDLKLNLIQVLSLAPDKISPQ